MPAGVVHYKYHQSLLIPVILIGIGVFSFGIIRERYYLSEVALWFVVWYWAGRYVDPDLDLQGITMAEGRMLRELDFLGVLLVPVTAFYAAGIGYAIRKFGIQGAIGGSHRTWLTHSLIPGTMIRQLLICSILVFVLNLANRSLSALFGGSLQFAPWDLVAFVTGQFLGLGAADILHISLDNYYGGE